jgi:integrase
MTEPAWQRLWRYYMNELSRQYGEGVHIQEFTPHCLRHTYCTMLYESGIDVVVAQGLMGHKDIKTTLGIYTHLSKEKAERDVSKLNDFLASKS